MLRAVLFLRRTGPVGGRVGDLSPSADPELHRYRLHDVLRPVPVRRRQPLFIQALGSGERPGIVPHEVGASTLVNGLLSPKNRLSVGSDDQVMKVDGSKVSPRFINVHATTKSLDAIFTCIFSRIPRSCSLPLISRVK